MSQSEPRVTGGGAYRLCYKDIHPQKRNRQLNVPLCPSFSKFHIFILMSCEADYLL